MLQRLPGLGASMGAALGAALGGRLKQGLETLGTLPPLPPPVRAWVDCTATLCRNYLPAALLDLAQGGAAPGPGPAQ